MTWIRRLRSTLLNGMSIITTRYAACDDKLGLNLLITIKPTNYVTVIDVSTVVSSEYLLGPISINIYFVLRMMLIKHSYPHDNRVPELNKYR